METDFASVLNEKMGDMAGVTLAGILTANGYTTTAATVSRWRSGERKPSFDAIIHIARALDCTPNDLLGVNGK